MRAKRCTKEILKTIKNETPWIDIDNAKAKFENATFISCKPGEGFMRVKTGHIFDENKTVKWNREEVERVNNEYQEEVARLNRVKNEAYQDAIKDIIHYIMQETDLSESKADVFWNYVYSKYHSGYELFDRLDEIIEFYNSVKEEK